MLNKKKVVVVAIIFAIIVALIAFVIIAIGNKATKVNKLYKKIEKAQEYLFEIKDESNYEITIAEKNRQISIDMNNNGERVTTLIKDGTEYLISHAQKEYYTYESNSENETVVIDMLKDLNKADSKGKEKINGKTYNYEEYKEFEGFMTSAGLGNEEKNVSTKFYFDRNELVYIKTIIDGQEEELLEAKLSYSVPDELFEIPSDYAEASIQ